MAGSVYADVKIAVVDFREVFSKIPQRDAVEDKLKKEFQDRGESLQKLQNDIRTQIERLQKDGATMSDQAKTEAGRKIEQAKADLQLKGKAFEEDTQRRKNEEQAQLERKIVQEVNKLAAKDGYSIVLSREAVAYVQPQFDITAQVIAAVSGPTATPAK